MKPEDIGNDLKRTLRYCKRNGIRDTVFSVAERLYLKASDRYSYAPPSDLDIREQREKSSVLEPAQRIRISVVVPAFNTDRHCLVQLIKSAAAQTYPWFELVIADAGDTDTVRLVCGEAVLKHVLKAPSGDAFTPGSLRYVKLDGNGGISGNMNAAVSHSKGQWIHFLDHDDLLTADALYMAASAIREHPGAVLVYFDEDKTDYPGRTFSDPNLKPGFNPDLLLTNNYICHAMTLRRDLAESFPLRSGYDGAQDYDLVLRILSDMMLRGLSLEEMRKLVVHEGRVTYHWRVHGGSSAGDSSAKTWAYDAGLRALRDFYDRMGIEARAVHSRHLGFFRTEYDPDIFSARKDVGVVCGRVSDAFGRMCADMMSLEGERLFEGMPVRFSGRLNRFDSAQDIMYGDMRNMRIRPELKHLLSVVAKRDDINKNEEICRLAREAGFTVVYDPGLGTVRG